MRKIRLVLSMVALLLAASSAMAAQTCSNVNAVINPGNQTVPEASVVNGTRVPTVVTFDGTNSNPKNNVTCAWTSLDNPQITITNSNSCIASFVAPEVGPSGREFRFQLTVTSTESGCTANTDSKETKVTVTNVLTNRAPVASAAVAGATPPYSVDEGAVVTLDGSGSSDPDGDALSYSWEQVIDPGNPTTGVTIDNNTGVSATFTAPPEVYPNGETLKFRLTVSDGNLSNSTEILVSVASVNQPPVASISCPGPVNEGTSVTLDSIGSSDPDLGPLTYQWSQVQGVPNADLTLADLNASSIAFTAPALTSYPYDTMKFGLTVTDNGKLTSYAECDVKVLDVTPPVISGTTDITQEATSASGAIVIFDPTAHDAFYGDVSVTCDPVSGSTFALDASTTVTCSASDMATPPNKADASFSVKVVDTTPPALTLPNSIGPIEGDTLGGAFITYTASALDIVDGSVSVTCVQASGSVFSVGTSTVNCSAIDAHKNQATGSFNVIVQDTKPPVITFGGNIGDGDSFYFGSVPAAPTCTASDVVSGTVDCKVSGYSTLVGTHTLTAEAKDGAGNTAISTRSYTVLPWTFKGFYSPVDMKATNTVKGGSTVPLKFEVFAGATELTATSSISSIQTQSINCDSVSATEDPVDALATGGTVLRYDATAGQFIYNWQTPKLPGTCYSVTATTLDGSTKVAYFKLK